ncbi:MAG: restriction endonuclease [Clostridia bacterium]|nr:restriction endonuclease [Clostridia bacterium]
MRNMADAAVWSVANSRRAYCKFLSANDTGVTGGHQAGILVSKTSSSILFDTPGVKGINKDREIIVRWQNDFTTTSRFIYYGQKTRNEYRMTRFGKGFPFLQPEYTGALFILAEMDDDDYDAFVLDNEEEIEQFLDSCGISPAETNRIIPKESVNACLAEEKLRMTELTETFSYDFPTSDVMSASARELFYHLSYSAIMNDADSKLIKWIELEYTLFRDIEYRHYGNQINTGFDNMEQFIALANQIINRRKSRAGKSLEHHLAALFGESHLRFEAQPVTEGNKRPDFIFPSSEAYHNMGFPTEKLITLAAKTTCKDRWRQILSEANRLRGSKKYLCTLQQGISPSQMQEMKEEGVILVVPGQYIASYPPMHREMVWSVGRFIDFVRETEEI